MFFPTATFAASSGANATAVYGQPNFTTNSGFGVGTSPQSLELPVGLALGPENHLLVSDSLESRILLFPPIPPSTPFGLQAIDVLGQQSFGTNTAGGSLSQLRLPRLIAWDEAYQCLWVVDQDNSRILKYCNIVPPSVKNNISSVGVQVSFSGRTPDVTLKPAEGSSGSVSFLLPLLFCAYFDFKETITRLQITRHCFFIRTASNGLDLTELSFNRSPSLKWVTLSPHPSIPNKTNTSNSSPPCHPKKYEVALMKII